MTADMTANMNANAQEGQSAMEPPRGGWVRDVDYWGEAAPDDYAAERCRLDLLLPRGQEDFATVVWFHPGGLTSGEKVVPAALRERGFAVAAVDYRLSPKATAPAYLDDAAAATAWVLNNIEQYGGDPSKVIVAGHSAGGYLVTMIGLDKSYLAAHDLDANELAGIASFSGQMITHFTVRDERGIAGTTPIVDEFAPLRHVRADAPPLMLLTGDRDMEMLGRYEENAYMWRMMKEAGHEKTELMELEGYDHGGMPDGGWKLLINKVRQWGESAQEAE